MTPAKNFGESYEYLDQIPLFVRPTERTSLAAPRPKCWTPNPKPGILNSADISGFRVSPPQVDRIWGIWGSSYIYPTPYSIYFRGTVILNPEPSSRKPYLGSQAIRHKLLSQTTTFCRLGSSSRKRLFEWKFRTRNHSIRNCLAGHSYIFVDIPHIPLSSFKAPYPYVHIYIYTHISLQPLQRNGSPDSNDLESEVPARVEELHVGGEPTCRVRGT